MTTKQTSSAVIFINLDTGHIFGVHSTQEWRRKRHQDKGPWGLPKGIVEPGEDALDTAVREMKEELDIELDNDKLLYLGKHKYLPVKDLEVFAYEVTEKTLEKMVDECKCVSYFTNHSGVEQPEIDDFKVCSIEDFGIHYQSSIKSALASYVN